MAETSIEWTEHTWNPIVGCSVVSPGCTNCYAMKMAARLECMGQDRYRGLTQPSKAGAVWTGEMRFVEEALTLPLRRRKPTTWFVNSMSDLFHESVPDEWIDRVFAVMALAPKHTFQVLTKRAARMRAYLSDLDTPGRIRGWIESHEAHSGPVAHFPHLGRDGRWPLTNVWLGVSAEDQRRADERVPDLLATPAAVRFVSAEPLLGPVRFYLSPLDIGLHWIIVGGESGRGARPMHPDWARSIRDECATAGVAFHYKQAGAWAALKSSDQEWPIDAGSFIRLRKDGSRGPEGWPMQLVGKKAAGRLLDGVEHNAMPRAA